MTYTTFDKVYSIEQVESVISSTWAASGAGDYLDDVL